MLKIKNLSLDLPNFKLQENSLNINNHEYFVLLGASGSGKTPVSYTHLTLPTILLV